MAVSTRLSALPYVIYAFIFLGQPRCHARSCRPSRCSRRVRWSVSSGGARSGLEPTYRDVRRCRRLRERKRYPVRRSRPQLTLKLLRGVEVLLGAVALTWSYPLRRTSR
jgi:hypothetical protein